MLSHLFVKKYKNMSRINCTYIITNTAVVKPFVCEQVLVTFISNLLGKYYQGCQFLGKSLNSGQ